MKKILLSLLIVLPIVLIGQNDYPKFTTDSAGNKLVVLTLEQAQSLDNKTDLLPLYEKVIIQVEKVDSSCIKTIQEKDKVVNSQDIIIKNQKELIGGKNREILNLNDQIINYKLTEETYKKEIDNKNKEVDLHLDKINKMKGKILISGGIGIVVGFIAAVLIIN